MDYLRTIIFFACAMSLSAQPLTQSELGWPTKTNIFVTPEAPPKAFFKFYVIPRDSGLMYATNIGTCTTSTNLTIYPNLAFHPFNGVATDVGEFADFTLGFNWVYDVSTYTPNAGFVGDDFYTYIVTNNISLRQLSDEKNTTFIVYDTNNTAGCSISLVTTNQPINILLPVCTGGQSEVFYIYIVGCFTNAYTCNNNIWTGPNGVTIFRTFTIPSPCQGNLCIAYTNTPVQSTNFCGTNLTDNLSNVVWVAKSAGAGIMASFSGTNDVITFNAKSCQQINGQGATAHYTICGGPTNRTVLVTGIVTNTTQNFSDTASINLNNNLVTNLPNQFGVGVYPISFSYTLTAQQTNIPEYEFIMDKKTSTLPPNNCNSISGVFTNTIQQ